MAEKVLIFGTDTCPYTTAAREDYAKKGYEIRKAKGSSLHS